MCDRGTPDGHHGIPDELLDRAAVAAYDLAAEVEVTSEQIPDRLRIPVLGQAGEADQIAEQHRDQAPLGDR